jgi:amidase
MVTAAVLVFDAMVGYDEADPYTATAPLAGRPKGGSYAANLSSETMRHARLGVHRVQMLGADSDPECAAVNIVVNRVLETLKSSGTHLMDIEIPGMEKSLFFTSIYRSRSRHDLDNFLSQRPHITPNTIAQIKAAGLYHKGLDLIDTIIKSPPHPHQDLEYHLRMEERDKLQKQLIGILTEINLTHLYSQIARSRRQSVRTF